MPTFLVLLLSFRLPSFFLLLAILLAGLFISVQFRSLQFEGLSGMTKLYQSRLPLLLLLAELPRSSASHFDVATGRFQELPHRVWTLSSASPPSRGGRSVRCRSKGKQAAGIEIQMSERRRLQRFWSGKTGAGSKAQRGRYDKRERRSGQQVAWALSPHRRHRQRH